MKLNGTPIEDFGLYPLKGQSHPTPQFTNKTVKVPGVAGEYHFGTEIGSRPFLIPLGVIEQDRITSQEKVRTFLEEVLDEQGNPKPCELIYDYEPDKYYTVYLSGNVSTNWTHEYGNASYQLVAYNPFAYASATAYDEAPGQYDTGLQYDSGLMYENVESFQWTYSTHYTGSYNYSFYSTLLIMEIEGTVANPRVTDLRTDKTMILPSISNEKLVIDCSKYTVTKDGVNAFKDASNVGISLLSGDIDLKFEGATPNATVTFKWKHKFM